jgi:hypothetical protein
VSNGAATTISLLGLSSLFPLKPPQPALFPGPVQDKFSQGATGFGFSSHAGQTKKRGLTESCQAAQCFQAMGMSGTLRS